MARLNGRLVDDSFSGMEREKLPTSVRSWWLLIKAAGNVMNHAFRFVYAR